MKNYCLISIQWIAIILQFKASLTRCNNYANEEELSNYPPLIETSIGLPLAFERTYAQVKNQRNYTCTEQCFLIQSSNEICGHICKDNPYSSICTDCINKVNNGNNADLSTYASWINGDSRFNMVEPSINIDTRKMSFPFDLKVPQIPPLPQLPRIPSLPDINNLFQKGFSDLFKSYIKSIDPNYQVEYASVKPNNHINNFNPYVEYQVPYADFQPQNTQIPYATFQEIPQNGLMPMYEDFPINDNYISPVNQVYDLQSNIDNFLTNPYAPPPCIPVNYPLNNEPQFISYSQPLNNIDIPTISYSSPELIIPNYGSYFDFPHTSPENDDPYVNLNYNPMLDDTTELYPPYHDLYTSQLPISSSNYQTDNNPYILMSPDYSHYFAPGYLSNYPLYDDPPSPNSPPIHPGYSGYNVNNAENSLFPNDDLYEIPGFPKQVQLPFVLKPPVPPVHIVESPIELSPLNNTVLNTIVPNIPYPYTASTDIEIDIHNKNLPNQNVKSDAVINNENINQKLLLNEYFKNKIESIDSKYHRIMNRCIENTMRFHRQDLLDLHNEYELTLSDNNSHSKSLKIPAIDLKTIEEIIGEWEKTNTDHVFN